jgi:AraC-like DNA-binding protein
MLKYYVDFTGSEATKLLKQSPLNRWRCVQVSAVREVQELFELLQREGASESPFGAKLCAGLIPVLLTKITERAVTAGTIEPRALATYERVKRWIEEHFMEVRTIGPIAQACHVDVAYLCRLFQRFAHTSPYQFLTRLKMGRATELLLDRALLVKETAAELGFPDPFQFSRAFKRVYGLSPEQFVRHGRGSIVSQANP